MQIEKLNKDVDMTRLEKLKRFFESKDYSLVHSDNKRYIMKNLKLDKLVVFYENVSKNIYFYKNSDDSSELNHGDIILNSNSYTIDSIINDIHVV